MKIAYDTEKKKTDMNIGKQKKYERAGVMGLDI